MSTTDITIENQLPDRIIAISGETMEKVDALLIRSHECQVHNLESWERGNAIHKEMHALSKAIEAQRKLLKAPLSDLITALDDAAKSAIQPLEDQKKLLGDRCERWKTEENRRRVEAARIAEEEARRIEAERVAAAEAERKRLEAAAEFDAPPNVIPEALPVFDAPIVRPVKPVWTPPPLKGTVKSKPEWIVTIHDASLIPREINGVVLMIPDEDAIKTLLKAGMTIPGASIEKIMSTSAKGR